MPALSDRPGLTLAGLTVACLVAFAVTVPLPRVDGELIGSDGIGYYVYLPSVWIDGDLDFADEYRHFHRLQPETARHRVEDLTPTGLPANRFGIGPALLWSPFFLVAHLLALLSNTLGAGLDTSGYGGWYQAPVLAASIVYGGLGAWLSLLAARRATSARSALSATLLVVLAGNAVYYLVIEPSMSHALSLFASAAFFQRWTSTRRHPGPRTGLQLGALAGLMALIRPQDGLFLLLPLVDGALSLRAGASHLRSWLTTSLTSLLAAAVVFAPQLVVWRLLNGAALRSGYAEELDTLFHSPLARLPAVLLSAERGLLTWHPVFLLALVGLALVRDRRLASAVPRGLRDPVASRQQLARLAPGRCLRRPHVHRLHADLRLRPGGARRNGVPAMAVAAPPADRSAADRPQPAPARAVPRRVVGARTADHLRGPDGRPFPSRAPLKGAADRVFNPPAAAVRARRRSSAPSRSHWSPARRTSPSPWTTANRFDRRGARSRIGWPILAAVVSKRSSGAPG